MKLPPRSLALALAALLLAASCLPEDESRLAERLTESRALASTFADALRGELKQALASGGPAVAISVCRDRAPLIASELSRQSGAKVRRTSLRYRNPANAPEPWEREALSRFDEQAASEEAPRPLEHYVELDDGTARYMAAIETAAVCLVCHGTALAAGVDEVLEQDYPRDRARNYATGDVRGAFSVTWPADADVGRR